MTNDREILLRINLDQDKALKDLVALKDRIAILKTEQKALDATTAEGKIQYAAYQAQITNLTKESRGLENALQHTAGAFNFEAGSIAANRAEYNKLVAELKNLAKPSQEQIDRAKQLSDRLKEQEKALGNTSRNVGNYAESIKEALLEVDLLRQKEAALREEQAKVDKATEEGKRTYAAYGAEIERVAEQVKKQETALGVAEKSQTSFKDAINETGLANTVLGQKLNQGAEGFQKLKAGVDAAKTGFTTLRGAIAATGIGLLVIALTSLFSYFTKTNEGSKRLAQGMAFIQTFVGVLIDKFSALGKIIFEAINNPMAALKAFGDGLKTFVMDRINLLMSGVSGLGKAFSQLFDGNFKEAAKTAGEAFLNINRGINPVVIGLELGTTAAKGLADGFKEIGKQAIESGQKAMILAEQLQRLTTLERTLSVSNAKRRAEAELLIKVADNNTAAEEKRMDALKRANLLLEESAKKELELLKAKLANLEATNSLTDSSEEDLQKEADLRIQIIEMEKQFTVLRQDNINKISQLQKEYVAKEIERIKSLDQAHAELEASRLSRNVDTTNKLLKNNEDELSKVLSNQKLNEQQKFEIGKEFVEAQKSLIDARLINEEIAESQRASTLLDNEQLLADDRVRIEEELAAKITDIRTKAAEDKLKIDESQAKREEAAAEAKVKLESMVGDAKMNLASTAFGAIASLMDQESAAYKLFASGQALIDMLRAQVAALAPPPVGLGPVFGPIAAATAGIQGVATIAKINGVKFAKGGFTGEGFGFTDETGEKPAGVVHHEEWVAPKWMNKHPKIRPMIKRLESIRLKGSYATGGYVGSVSNFNSDGGLNARSMSQPVMNGIEQRNNIAEVVSSFPPIVVKVDDINKVNNRKTKVKALANS